VRRQPAPTKELRSAQDQDFRHDIEDGEQSPGIALQQPRSARIALALERLGVDIVEAGFAASSPGDFRGVAEVARSVSSVTVAVACSDDREDIDAAAEALKGAPRNTHSTSSSRPARSTWSGNLL